MADRGMFISDWTNQGDLALALNLLRPAVVAYRFGLWFGTRFQADNRLWDMRYISAVVPFTFPVIVIQPVGVDKLIQTCKMALEFSGGNTLALDVEIDFNTLYSDLTRLITHLKDRGVGVIVYTNHDFIKRYRLNNPSVTQRAALWLAHYAERPKPVFGWGDLILWQRAPKVTLNGVTINVTDEVYYPPTQYEG